MKPFSLYLLNPEDIFFINETRSYYPNQLIGRVFENKLTKTVYNLERSFFNRLNFNLLLAIMLCFILKSLLSFWQKRRKQNA